MPTSKEIQAQYARLMAQPIGAKWHKVEMHVHTPGSRKDFKVYGTPFERLSTKDLLEISAREGLISQDLARSLGEDIRAEDVAAELIAWKGFQEKISLMCITDHFNSEWARRVRDAVWNISRRMRLGWGPKILPGVEICDVNNHHVIAIFREKAEDQVRELLRSLGVPEDQFGKQSVLVNRTLLQLLDTIKAHQGIAYLPHLDSGEKVTDMLGGHAGFWREVFTNPTLAAVGLRNVKSRTLLIDHLKSRKVEPPPFLVDSDAHDVAEIGRSPVWLKMGKPGFDGLCYALEDPRLHVAYSEPELQDRPTVLGLCVLGGFFGKKDRPEEQWEYFRFNPDLSCLVGGRGTGKSTVLLLLSSCLRGTVETSSQRRFLAQFTKVLLYLTDQGVTYCIAMVPQVYWDEYTRSFEEDLGQATNLSIENWLFLYVKRKGRDRFDPVGDRSKAHLMRQSLPFMNLYSQNRIYELAKSPEALLGTLDDIVANSNRLSQDWAEVRSSHATTCERWNATVYSISESRRAPRDLEALSAELVESFRAVNAVREKAIALLNQCLAGRERLSLADQSRSKWYEFLLKVCGIKDETKESAWLLMVRGVVRRYSVSSFIQTVLRGDCEAFWRTVGELSQYCDDERDQRRPVEFNKVDAFEQLRHGVCRAWSDDLLSCMSHPVLLVEHNVNVNAANPATFVNVNELSPGQRCVALLDLILYGGVHLGDERPLVIDQPEDHIDNRYVYEHLVDALRYVKGHRQVILVTHNPNLAVGADTEQIIRLEAENRRGWIAEHGGMDEPRIRRAIIGALEGGLPALELRVQKYFPGSKSVLQQLLKGSRPARQE